MEPEYFLKPKELHRSLQATESPRDLLALLYGGIGLRMGGLTHVRVEDMDLEAGYLIIRASNAQWKKNHTVILSPLITIELRSYLTDNAINQGYFFPGRPS